MIFTFVNIFIIPWKDLKLHKLRLPAATEREVFQHFLQMFSHDGSCLTLTALEALTASVGAF